ncbi:MAG: hypothetical protein WBX19_03210 [Terracidiphilus sp.]|jgi:hypothetical protein
MASRKLIGLAFMFTGTLLCFFLPFVTVSCNGMKVYSFTGQQLATGTTMSQPEMFGPPKTQKVDPNAFAAVAFLCSAAGVILCLLGRKMIRSVAVTASVGSASLLAMKIQLDHQIQKQGMGVAENKYQFGFFIALLLMMVSAGWSLYQIVRERKGETVEEGTPRLS